MYIDIRSNKIARVSLLVNVTLTNNKMEVLQNYLYLYRSKEGARDVKTTENM